MIKKYIISLAAILLAVTSLVAAPSDTHISGHVLNARTKEHIPYVNIIIKNSNIGTVTDATGHFFLKNIPENQPLTLEASLIGFSPVEKSVTVRKGSTATINFELREDIMSLDQVVVSASRSNISRQVSPSLVNVLSGRTLEMVSAASIADGLCYQPGVRVEDNCQNCGFNQVRINGLDGHYSQILLDSRPIFSALTGVYGLEQIPAAMIDRVEVVRGGGSALFGSAAIGGTINIITKDPTYNSAELSHSLMAIGGKSTFDNNTTFNASVVSENQQAGLIIYGQRRNRDSYDHDSDGFSELPTMDGTTVGLRSFFKTGLRSKLTLQYHSIKEFRRGGDQLDLPPHEAYIAEQTDHNIHGGGVNFDLFSRSYKAHLNLFSSMQSTHRDSYYGGNQDLNAYGNTKDLVYIGGAQYTQKFDHLWFMPSEFIAGIEYSYNRLQDRSIGYNHDVDQTINIWGSFFQNEWRNDRWGFLLGGRIDKHNLINKAIFSPRANIRFNPSRNLNFRLSYSTGFRAPQAFDEDFHIAIVGGERVHTVLAKDLKEERSNSFSFSADMYRNFDNLQTNLLVEAFYTTLKDVFSLREIGQTTSAGYQILERYNGSGATVKGFNIEGKAIYKETLQLQGGLTIQQSRYKKPEQWSEDLSVPASKKVFRAPDLYGYLTLGYDPSKKLNISCTGTYTGSMLVQHMAGSGTPIDQAVKTDDFFDLNIKCSYDFTVADYVNMQINAGVRNLFDSYQNDFDRGAERDSGYIYGPSLPRSLFVGIKFAF